MTGILLGQEVRKRKTPQEKIDIIQQTMEPGMNVSHVARLHGIQPSLLFKWKKQYGVQRRNRRNFRREWPPVEAGRVMCGYGKSNQRFFVDCCAIYN